MKKISLFVFAAAMCCTPVFAGDDPFADTHKSLKDQAFVVETDEDSGTESLNRIAGNIDLGFTTPDQEFQSSDQYKPGPFSQEESKDKTRQSY